MRFSTFIVLCLMMANTYVGMSQVTQYQGSTSSSSLTSGAGTITAATDGTLTVTGDALFDSLITYDVSPHMGWFLQDSDGLGDLAFAPGNSGTVTNVSGPSWFTWATSTTTPTATVAAHAVPDSVLSTNVPLLNITNNFSTNMSVGGRLSLGTNASVNVTNILFPLVVDSPAGTSTREYIFKGTVSDAGDDAFYVDNGVLSDGHFVPEMLGFVDSFSTSAAFGVSAVTTTTNDTGSVPVLTFNGFTTTLPSNPRNGTLAAIMTRPLFAIQNFGVNEFVVGNQGNATVSGYTVSSNGMGSSISNATMFTLTMPATTVNLTNTNSVSWLYFIDNTGVTGTVVKKNGVQILSSIVSDVTIGLRPGETFSETYTLGTPALTGNVFP